MTRAVVFTPTRSYGGLDVTVRALQEQTEQEFAWVVVDELYAERRTTYLELDVPVVALEAPPSSTYRNLCRSYNRGVEFALEHFPEAEIFVTLQDFIWPPADGLKRFLDLTTPGALVTGACSVARTPTRDEVHDFEGLYTIFAEPITERPSDLLWRDCRLDEHPEICGIPPVEWEANWAAVHMALLKDGLRWDERYDKGVAYENQKFAMDAIAMGGHVIMDPRNHAISLPHKQYWPEWEQEDMKHLNKEWHEAGAA